MRSDSKEPNDIIDLAAEARALLEATANVTGQKVESARKRLELAFERGKANDEDLSDESAGVLAEKAQKLRDVLADTVNRGKEIYDKVHDDVVHGAKATDDAVRLNPYKTLGIALGVGAILGFVLSRCHSCKGK